jgi:hypothetical protein
LAEIAKAHPNRPLIAALSKDYLAAVEADLIKARDALADPDLLIIVSSGAEKVGSLEPHFLPCTSRMENRLGMGRSSLNVRILAEIMATRGSHLRASLLRKAYYDIQAQLAQSTYPKRSRTTDDEVLDFIRTQIQEGTPTSHSRLLRKFREAGKACEQSRFRNLFDRVNSE